jgi:hypothetical protein
MKVISAISTLTALLLLQGCSTTGMPGHVSESVSKFDNTRQISMEPAWLYDSPIKLSLFWNSNMKNGDIYLYGTVKGAHSIARGQSLHFNVDGKIKSFSSTDTFTDFQTTSGGVYNSSYIAGSNWSTKRYLINSKFLTEILSAKYVAVKIDLQKEYVEGVFSRDAMTTARPAFRNFRAKASRYWAR